METGFHCVYILTNTTDKNRHCTVLTKNLESRLVAFNAGQVAQPSNHRPWLIETAVAFRSREKAAKFESYLKSHSGRAFAARDF